jgi:4-hydroxy-tetrahydrodipicolinate synthase
MNDGKVTWEGSFPAIVTPFRADGSVDEALFLENVELSVREGAHGLVIGGHNGEAPLMGVEERIRLFELAIPAVAGRIPVICGSGHARTDLTIQMTRAAKALGADGVMIETPYYMTPSDDDVVAHYQLVSDTVEIPILVYNNPRRTGCSVRVELLERLANVEQVVAVKDSAGDFLQVVESIRACADRIEVFIGPARLFGFPAVAMGAKGFVEGLPQIMGSDIARLYELSRAGHNDEAKALQYRCYAAGEAIYKNVKSFTYPATLKAVMNLQGRPGGLPRLPLRPLDDAALAILERDMAAIGLLEPVGAVHR